MRLRKHHTTTFTTLVRPQTDIPHTTLSHTLTTLPPTKSARAITRCRCLSWQKYTKARLAATTKRTPRECHSSRLLVWEDHHATTPPLCDCAFFDNTRVGNWSQHKQVRNFYTRRKLSTVTHARNVRSDNLATISFFWFTQTHTSLDWFWLNQTTNSKQIVSSSSLACPWPSSITPLTPI